MYNLSRLIKEIPLDNGKTLYYLLLKREISYHEVIIELKNNGTPYDIINVAKYIPGISLHKLGELIINFNDPFYVFTYAENIPVVPNILTDYMIKTKKTNFIYWYGYYINLKESELDKIINALDALYRKDYADTLREKKKEKEETKKKLIKGGK